MFCAAVCKHNQISDTVDGEVQVVMPSFSASESRRAMARSQEGMVPGTHLNTDTATVPALDANARGGEGVDDVVGSQAWLFKRSIAHLVQKFSRILEHFRVFEFSQPTRHESSQPWLITKKCSRKLDFF